ncbi:MULTISPECIES: TniB family NTP-binding protein [Lysinibacillus]|uniref:TniB family NTP-binding protein n=1 Tax=Lysinibacillus TaxID=400634 RepID=UPI00214B1ABE|nr:MULTISPECIES: TniB family NTP-binding protein [Lysinibacillus]UUV23641.1 TniB family NTP-binding protein [Lysinibacillus sp. FN11]UYB46512.1 TniB family NTP-binding protein [Lysinibacillus capsici]
MKNSNRRFNEELLLASKEERLDYFKDYTVAHPKLEKALIELKKAIYSPDNFNVIMVVGPSGVGKSRLFEQTIRSILKDMAEDIEQDKSIIPVTGIELPNPDLGKFNWKDFYYRVLTSLNEPLIDFKIDYEQILGKKVKKKISPLKSETTPELRRSLENAFLYRETKALLIDEAQHFFDVGTSVKMQKQFNSIKSLSNMANTKIVLFGTYDLNSVINLDGQLSRRVYEIHFPRYDYSNVEEMKMFKNMLFSFQKALPLEEEPNLIMIHEYIYENSIGCAGIVKDWLQRCLSEAIDNNEKTITLDSLARNAINTKKLLTLVKEANSGELDFIESKQDREELKTLLGINGDTKETSVQKKKGNTLPGIRNPQRDAVEQVEFQ